MTRSRAADIFATIRTRIEELRRERAGAKAGDKDAQRDPPMPRRGAAYAGRRQRSPRGQDGRGNQHKGNDGCGGLLNGSPP